MRTRKRFSPPRPLHQRWIQLSSDLLEDVGSGALGHGAVSVSVDTLDNSMVDHNGGPLVPPAGTKDGNEVQLKIQGLGELGLGVGGEGDLFNK